MGLFDWLKGKSEDDEYEESADKGVEENIKEIVEILNESIESGHGTSWFDKLFGGGDDDGDDDDD